MIDKKEPFLTDFDNPYAPPVAAVADVIPGAGRDFQPVKIFSTKGRIGRLRYFAYIAGVNLILYVAVMVLAVIAGIAMAAAGMAGKASLVGMVIGGVLAIPHLIFYLMIGIQRSHDMNLSGWTALLTLIPFVGLYWLFESGTKGANRFGAPPPPNSTGVKVFFWSGIFLSVIWVLSMITVVLLPYYAKRAQAVQSQQLQR